MIDVEWDAVEEMWATWCRACESEVFSDTEEQANAEGAEHIANGHVWAADQDHDCSGPDCCSNSREAT